MICDSLATCSYQLLSIASTASLNMLGCRLFQDNHNYPRLLKPLITSSVAKVLSFIPYYLSHEVQKDFGHPISGSVYPGLFALATGYASKRTGARLPSIRGDTFTTLFSTATSFSHVFLQQHLGGKSFCNLLNHSLSSDFDKFKPPKSRVSWSSLTAVTEVFDRVALNLLGVVTAASMKRTDPADFTTVKKWGFRLSPLFAVSTIRKLIRFFGNSELRLYMNTIRALPVDCPFFLGMVAGALSPIGGRKPIEIENNAFFGTILFATISMYYSAITCYMTNTCIHSSKRPNSTNVSYIVGC